MKAVVFAYSNIGCAGIEALLRNGFEIAAVFTHKDQPGENIWFDSVAKLAASRGLPVFAPADVNHPMWEKRIRDLAPDIIFSFYYRDILKAAILDIPLAGGLNLHGSLLPAYRGRCPMNWVLVNGETETGVTLHYMTPQPDDGDIVGQRAFPISDEDTALSLHLKATTAASGLLDELLPRLSDGSVARFPQEHAAASYYGARRPADGEIDWSRSAREVHNLVRAVTRPYPGAFSYVGDRKFFFWDVSEVPGGDPNAPAGRVLSSAPLVVACAGGGSVRVNFAQAEGDVYTTGKQVARDSNLLEGSTFGVSATHRVTQNRKTRVLILGVNGFIGNALTERLLESDAYEIYGMDLCSDHIQRFIDDPRFYFKECDIAIHREWLEYHVRKCDVVLPLVAIATPIEYTRNPLRVFELDFEENLRVIRYCVKYGKRLIFPSTSEVYGMCEDEKFDEESSSLVLGPIRMQRWIYSCCKQLLDRVIWAYGQQRGLQFTLFRPFNWIGPRLDSLDAARIGSSRVITQFILNLVEGSPIQLVDGGGQKRCFTDVSEGVECLFRIIENRNGLCRDRIINIGNPQNEVSIRELAEVLVKAFDAHPLRASFPPFAGYQETESRSYYGVGYQDMNLRKPSIRNARKLLNWRPVVELDDSIEKTLDFFLRDAIAAETAEVRSPVCAGASTLALQHDVLRLSAVCATE